MPDLERKKQLLEAAKNEFLEYGYQKASLRRIVKNADMTTGAIYFFFKDKADLFDALVSDVANQAQRIVDASARLEVESNNDEMLEEYFSLKLGKDLINLYFDYPEEVVLLFNKSEGSHYADFKIILRSYIEKRIHTLVEEKVGKDSQIFNDRMINWLANSEVEGFMYALSLKLSREETLEMIEQMVAYLMAGFNRLYEMEKEK